MASWLDVLKQVGPVVLALTPAAPFVPAVLAGIELAEKLGGSGEEKKAAAIQTASAVAYSVNQATGEKVMDPAVLGATVGNVIDTVVSVVNATHKAQGVGNAE